MLRGYSRFKGIYGEDKILVRGNLSKFWLMGEIPPPQSMQLKRNRVLTRTLLGPVNKLFTTEFIKTFSQLSLYWQQNLFLFFLCKSRFISFTMSFGLFSICCLLFLHFYVLLCYLYREKVKINVQCFLLHKLLHVFFSCLFNNLNRKEHT